MNPAIEAAIQYWRDTNAGYRFWARLDTYIDNGEERAVVTIGPKFSIGGGVAEKKDQAIAQRRYFMRAGEVKFTENVWS